MAPHRCDPPSFQWYLTPGSASPFDGEGETSGGWPPVILSPTSSTSDEEFNVLKHPERAVVTGAFGYTGGYVARRLIDQGVRVRTLSRRGKGPTALGRMLETAPLDFSDPDDLRRSMEGAGVLYNSYWIRFARGQTTFDLAVENTRTLLEAAKQAGVGRIVHFSVANASATSGLPYFRGKGRVEEMLMDLRVPHAIIRPTLVFGVGDLLLNNMA